MTIDPHDRDLRAAWPTALAERGLTLRAQTPRDGVFLRTLYGIGRADELAATEWPAAERRRFLDDQFRLQCLHYGAPRPGMDRWIVVRSPARAAARPIGRLYLDRTLPIWRLQEIALLPAEQGAGIGHAIVGWLIEQAPPASGIDLHVTVDNPRAAAFYARLGFRNAPGASITHRRMTCVYG